MALQQLGLQFSNLSFSTLNLHTSISLINSKQALSCACDLPGHLPVQIIAIFQPGADPGLKTATLLMQLHIFPNDTSAPVTCIYSVDAWTLGALPPQDSLSNIAVILQANYCCILSGCLQCWLKLLCVPGLLNNNIAN